MASLRTNDFLTAVALGEVPGHSYVNKFGRNADVDSASGYEVVWDGGGTAYTGFNATALEAVEVLSSAAADAGTQLSTGTLTGGSATTFVDTAADFVTDTVAVGDIVINDTQDDHGIVTAVTSLTTLTVRNMRHGTTPASGDTYRVVTPASTGAAVIRLPRLLTTANNSLGVEYIVLNGVTGVDTTGTYLRCSRARVVLAGSGLGNAGTITARQTTTTANIFLVMPIGYNSSMVACDTVPPGAKGWLLGWHAAITGVGAADVNVRILARPTGETFQVQEDGNLRGGGASALDRRFHAPKGPYPAWTDIMIDADTDTDNTPVSAGFDLLIVAD